MAYVIDQPKQAAIPVDGGGEFPVRRVWCVGRNYLDHVREMGNDPSEPPFFFAKPPDALTTSDNVPYPPATSDLHHEVELLVAIGKGGASISRDAAMAHIWGAGVAVDLTRRDLQADAKSAGRPWDMAKGFDASAPVAPILPIKSAPSIGAGDIWLDVNGERRQRADLGDMIWPVPDIIEVLSSLVELAPGDVVLTGTPAGVGTLNRGDSISCGVEGFPELIFSIEMS